MADRVTVVQQCQAAMSRATAFKDRMDYHTSAIKSSQSPVAARLPKLDLDAAQKPKLSLSSVAASREPKQLVDDAAARPPPQDPVREEPEAGSGHNEASSGKASVEAARILAARLPVRGDEGSRVPTLKLPRQELEVEIPGRPPLSPVQAYSLMQGAAALYGTPQRCCPHPN